ncbi:septum site-determining protein MinC [Ornithinibacillus halotolerans]|uniref:Probable septum site-determining protein MinC n=1 Tax=Ornithinibacillus halotolerans TaxID=1274357 RepID=A0A916WCD7_9BACI|nr:septum site-determining protein MinC [Ornithinibacillus halotolerans]GGA85912.1 putative septum site-determining protein MinC [Ornithinibacillus halotolerans]
MQDAKQRQYVTIKGTREGLTLFIDDRCSFEEACSELREKLSVNKSNKEDKDVAVTIKLGNRYLYEDQKEMLEELITELNQFTIQAIESNVILRDEALEMLEETEVKAVNRIVRSGQVLEVKGDLLLVGDVNPGGKVVSTGNIYIMGSLHGIAHAGSEGDRNAIITASYMNPSQLRIADYISRAPDYESDGVYMECGLIDTEKDKIIIDRLQVLAQRRNSLSRFERSLING